MGDFFSPSSTTQFAPFKDLAWKPQQPYIQRGLRMSLDALNDARRSGTNFRGDFTADLTNAQMTDIGRARETGTGMNNMGMDLMKSGFGGVNNFENYSSNADQIFNRASADPTGRVLANAQQYANNPMVQEQIDSAIRDVNRGFGENVAGINSSAVGSGNMNSTRAGVMEAAALRDARNTAADISTGIRTNAYNTGLSMAAAQDAQQTNDMLNANNMVGQAGSQFLGLLGTGSQLAGQGVDGALSASNILQQQQQNEINGAINRDQYNSNRDLDLLSKYMAMIGGNYGRQGFNSSVSQQASPFQQILGGVASVAGIGGKLFGK